jgi:hypothetical protein
MCTSRRASAFAGLALACLFGLGASLAAAAVREDAPALTLDSADVTAKWRQGWLRPGAAVRFGGTVAEPSSLTVVLRPTHRGVVTARKEFTLAKAGPYTLRLRLPPRALPGDYTLRILGKSDTADLTPVKTTVTVPAPPEGVVDRALVGTTPEGPWLSYVGDTGPALHGLYKDLWVRFRFLYPPSGRKIELVWKLRWHTIIGRVCRRFEDTIDTHAGSGDPLPSGTWNVLLKIDGRVAKQMDVRLVSGPKHFGTGKSPGC